MTKGLLGQLFSIVSKYSAKNVSLPRRCFYQIWGNCRKHFETTKAIQIARLRRQTQRYVSIYRELSIQMKLLRSPPLHRMHAFCHILFPLSSVSTQPETFPIFSFYSMSFEPTLLVSGAPVPAFGLSLFPKFPRFSITFTITALHLFPSHLWLPPYRSNKILSYYSLFSSPHLSPPRFHSTAPFHLLVILSDTPYSDLVQSVTLPRSLSAQLLNLYFLLSVYLSLPPWPCRTQFLTLPSSLSTLPPLW